MDAHRVQPCFVSRTHLPNMYTSPDPIRKIEMISMKSESGVGFSYGWAELALKIPPPLVPTSLIDSWGGDGPLGNDLASTRKGVRGHVVTQVVRNALPDQWLCDLQIMHGATALVIGGTTGEAWTLSSAEHAELIRIAAGVARGRLPVIAGAGSNATADAVALSKVAEANGADAILSVCPYYNKPTQEGLCAHYREIAAATELPVVLHDVPSRTVRGLTDESVARLAAGAADHRTPGRNGRCRPSLAAARPRRSGFQASLRRRRDGFGIFGAGRRRLHFRCVQYRAGLVPAYVSFMAARACVTRSPDHDTARAIDRGSRP